MAAPQTASAPHVREWALLFYVCADVPLKPNVFRKEIHEHLSDVARAIQPFDVDACHVFVQIDTSHEGATRWRLVRDGTGCRFERAGANAPRADKMAGKPSKNGRQLPTRINTGEPAEAIDFLEWAIQDGPAQHYAVVISGYGISRDHVQKILHDTKDFGRKEQIEQFQQQNLFSICHDASHLDALEAHELRGVFQRMNELLKRPVDIVVLDAGLTAFIELAYQLRGLVDYCVAADGILPDWETANTDKPKGKWPWPWSSLRTVLGSWRQLPDLNDQSSKATSSDTVSAEQVARNLATGFNGSFKATTTEKMPAQMVALRLQPITEAVGWLDHLTSTLLQNIGDWHVLNALLTVWQDWGILWKTESSPSNKKWDHDIDRCDVFQLLLLIEAALELEVAATPKEFGMRARIRRVLRVATRVRTSLVPDWCAQSHLKKWRVQYPTDLKKKPPRSRKLSPPPNAQQSHDECESRRKSFLEGLTALERLHPKKQSAEPEKQEPVASGTRRNREAMQPSVPDQQDGQFLPVRLEGTLSDPVGLMILLPWSRDLKFDEKAETNKDRDQAATSTTQRTGPPQDNRHTSYADLDFSRDAGWPLLVTALQLITWKPHVLWRIVSSMLFSRSGATRDVMYRRLFSSRSVLSDMQNQFRAFKSDQALRMSIRLESKQNCSHQNIAKRPLDAEPTEDCEICHGLGDRETFRLQLESASSEAVISENVSPVYRSTFRTAVRSFNEIVSGNGTLSDSVSVLERLGRSLGEDVIQDLKGRLEQIRAELAGDTAIAPHLRLQIDTDLMAYPWELISDGRGMLFERFALGRQFFMTSHARRHSIRSGGPLRVLVLGDPTFDPQWLQQSGLNVNQLPGAVREATEVVELFRDLREDLEGVVDIWIESHIGESMTVNDARGWLRSDRYDIIHFAGHACFNVDDPEGSGWLLSDGLLHAREIRNTLEWVESPPWLVYANACEAGMDRSHADYGYQTDVYGLSSAFTAHGVRGYIAPLWPINDDVAVLMATEFYCSLLLDRLSLGEALYTAKTRAKNLLVGPDPQNQGSELSANTALSWASVVLYGDPTQKMFQSLWGGAASASKDKDSEEGSGEVGVNVPPSSSGDELRFERSSPSSRESMTPQRRRRFMPRIRQAPARQILESVQSESMTAINLTREISELPDNIEKVLQLVEADGIRQWVVLDRHTDQTTPIDGGGLMAMTGQPAFRALLGINRRGDRSAKDYCKIIGKWAVNLLPGSDQKPDALMKQFAEQFDKNTVKTPGLLEYVKGHVLIPVNRETWQPLQPGQRILLVIHGTFSKSSSPKDGFTAKFWEQFLNELIPDPTNDQNPKIPLWRILFYDHHTLSVSPRDNAKELQQKLNELTLASGGSLLKGLLKEVGRAKQPPLDIIVHSRGGLVARAFCELIDQSMENGKLVKMTDLIRHVFFLGTPNAGTQLAAPKNFGRLANYLLNLVHQDPTGLMGKLSSFLAETFVRWQMKANIPGLEAQNPETIRQPGSLLNDLHEKPTGLFPKSGNEGIANREWPKYLCVAANFEPGDLTDGFDVSSMGKFFNTIPEFAKSLAGVGFDQLTDTFMNEANDLVVNTASVWSFRQGWKQKCDAAAKIDPGSVLLFNGADDFNYPEGVELFRRPWIHHCSLFGQPETQDFILRRFGLKMLDRK